MSNERERNKSEPKKKVATLLYSRGRQPWRGGSGGGGVGVERQEWNIQCALTRHHSVLGASVFFLFQGGEKINIFIKFYFSSFFWTTIISISWGNGKREERENDDDYIFGGGGGIRRPTLLRKMVTAAGLFSTLFWKYLVAQTIPFLLLSKWNFGAEILKWEEKTIWRSAREREKAFKSKRRIYIYK